MVRIVDPETSIECPAGTVGEIWVHGDNVAAGYWQKPQETERTFGATLVDPSAGTPEGPWLRTGDLGFFSDGELFIIGRIKDLLIVYGRNHSPDDIEATIQEITRGRCVAIAVPDEGTEKLVAIVELKKRGDSDEAAMQRMRVVKREVTSAISKSHGLSVADLVLVPPGSIPITTSGKVRERPVSSCTGRISSPAWTLSAEGESAFPADLWGRAETPEHAAHRNGAHLGCRALPPGPQRFSLPLRNPPGASTAASAWLPHASFCSRTSIPRASSILTSPIT